MDVILSPRKQCDSSSVVLTPLFDGDGGGGGGSDRPRDALLLDWLSHAVGRKIVKGQSIIVHVGSSEVYKIVYNDDENGLTILDQEVLIDRFVRQNVSKVVDNKETQAFADNAFRFRVDPMTNKKVAFIDSTISDEALRRRLNELCARARQTGV
jgi:hypothetical protein